MVTPGSALILLLLLRLLAASHYFFFTEIQIWSFKTTILKKLVCKTHYVDLKRLSWHPKLPVNLMFLFSSSFRLTAETPKAALLSLVRGIDRRPMDSPHKGTVRQKMFPFDDVIMVRFVKPQRVKDSTDVWFFVHYWIAEIPRNQISLFRNKGPIPIVKKYVWISLVGTYESRDTWTDGKSMVTQQWYFANDFKVFSTIWIDLSMCQWFSLPLHYRRVWSQSWCLELLN